LSHFTPLLNYTLRAVTCRCMSKKASATSSMSDDIVAVVNSERKSLNAAFKKASDSKKSAKAFLVSAGIINKKGELAKAYR